MIRKDIARLLHALDSLDAPVWDATRVRIEAILIEAKIAIDREERERPRRTSN